MPLKEEAVTPETTSCYYCKGDLGNAYVKYHDHLNGVFRGYVHSKCNL